MEAALQAAEIDHLVLSVVALRVAATVYPVYRVAAWSAEWAGRAEVSARQTAGAGLPERLVAA